MKNHVSKFENYIVEHIEALLEASNLSKTGMPKQMISAIHQKEEHKTEDYPKLGYVHRGGRPLVMPYKYYSPSHEIEVGSPLRFIGRPVEDPKGLRKSRYTDFAQFLIDIPMGPIRILLANPDKDFWMYMYHKSPRQNGEQYAILIWDSENNAVNDYGFVGLTDEGVERKLVRDVHMTKGGNTNQKVQEIVFQLTDGPSRENPLYVYEFEVNAAEEPKHKERAERKKATYGNYPTPSAMIVDAFAAKYAGAIKKMKPEFKSKLIMKLLKTRSYTSPDLTKYSDKFHALNSLASVLGVDRNDLFGQLYQSFANFRQEMLKAGGASDKSKGAYGGTSGYEIKDENAFASLIGMSRVYYTSDAYDPSDPRPEPTRIRYDIDRNRRKIPTEGSYASIDQMLNKHGMDGVLSRFMIFILTGEINNAAVNLADVIFGGEAKAKELGLDFSDVSSWIV